MYNTAWLHQALTSEYLRLFMFLKFLDFCEKWMQEIGQPWSDHYFGKGDDERGLRITQELAELNSPEVKRLILPPRSTRAELEIRLATLKGALSEAEMSKVEDISTEAQGRVITLLEAVAHDGRLKNAVPLFQSLLPTQPKPVLGIGWTMAEVNKQLAYVLAAFVVAAAIFAGFWYQEYNSPFNQCVRSMESLQNTDHARATVMCFQISSKK